MTYVLRGTNSIADRLSNVRVVGSLGARLVAEIRMELAFKILKNYNPLFGSAQSKLELGKSRIWYPHLTPKIRIPNSFKYLLFGILVLIPIF